MDFRLKCYNWIRVLIEMRNLEETGKRQKGGEIRYDY